MTDVGKQIESTCLALQAARIPISMAYELADHYTPGKDILLDAQSDKYQSQCQSHFKKAFAIQELIQKRNPSRVPSLWTPAHIQAISAYQKKSKLPVVFVIPYEKPASLVAPMTIGKTVYLPMQLHMEPNTQDIVLTLEHEQGHMRDEAILIKANPNLAIQLQRGMTRSGAEVADLINSYLFLFYSAQKDEKTKKAFQDSVALFREAVMDYSVAGIISLLSELLRYGEQTQQEKFIKMELEHGPADYFKAPANPSNYWPRVLVMSYYQVCGIWGKMQTAPSFNKQSITDIKPEHVAFFKTCILASQKYFPKK
ncbi:MAG: hypothetical protein ACD_73C00170G0001 [uncultured bacterium]|nr:MAG: hypothetical protein ACD_73C00170G0001 [uncultured bacterium]